MVTVENSKLVDVIFKLETWNDGSSIRENTAKYDQILLVSSFTNLQRN